VATGPVEVPAPSFSDPVVSSLCARLVAALPEELDDGVRRRPVVGDAKHTAAWGDPAITLRCGVPLPDRSLEPIEIDGLKLVTVTSAGVRTWTTFDRVVNVSLTVPTAYTEQVYDVQPLVPLFKQLPGPSPSPSP
jgi:hypothetical protein